MTNPLGGPTGIDSYERQLGPLSDVGKQEWDQFLRRRQELIDAFLGSAQSAVHAADIPTTLHSIGPPQVVGGLEGVQQDESRRDLLARAYFWKIPNADQLSTQDLQTQLAAKRAEVKIASQTTVGSIATAFGGAVEEGVSAAARLTGNLLQNVVGDAPFIGETLSKILQIDKAKNWLYNWSSKLDESAQMIVGQQPEQDRSAAQFLTAAGKTAGYVLPAIAAWEGIGALGAGINVPGWLARASTPLTRLAVRGALTSAVLEDPLSSPGDKAVNLGLGAVLGASQIWGKLGIAAGGGFIGAAVGAGVGDIPEERKRNQILGGIGGATLGIFAPMAAAALVKTREGFPSPLDQKVADAEYTRTTGTTGVIPADQSSRSPLTEDVVIPEFIGEPRQVSGNPPPKRLSGPQGQLGTVNTAEDLSALFRSDPVHGVEAPERSGLIPATTAEPPGAAIHNDAANLIRTLAEVPGTDIAAYPTEAVAQMRRQADLQVFEAQRNAPPEANGQGLAGVTNGPGHLIGSKVAAADGSPLRVYHGTFLDYEVMDLSKADPEAMYGPGGYFTESLEIAGGDPTQISPMQSMPNLGYATGLSPNVHPAFLDIKRPFEVDKQWKTEEYTQIVDRIATRNPGYNWNQVRSALNPSAEAQQIDPTLSRQLSGSEFYNLISQARTSESIQGPQQQVGNWMDIPIRGGYFGKAGVNQALQDLGYDGITHIGGARTGDKPHRVWVAFKSEQIHMPWNIDPMAKGEAVGTAESITKQATVMEAATLPDAMGKPGVTDSDVISAMKATNPGGVSILRNVGRPLEALLEHPDINFVEREGRLDAFVGESTPEMRDDYQHWGVYESQIIATPKGQEGTVLSVNGKGIATVARSGGGPPLRLKASNLLPSRFGQPTRQAPDLWDSFKADLLGYMNDQADKLSMQPVYGIFDSRVGDVMQHHMEDYLDRRGINDPVDRHAIDAYMNQRYIEEARDIDPESRDLQARMTDAAVKAQNEVADTEVISTEELATPKGFIWIKEPGTSGGMLRDTLNPDSGLEIPMQESDVPDFLHSIDRTAPDLTPSSTIPFEVAENIPTDTAIEPRAGVEEVLNITADAEWKKYARETVGSGGGGHKPPQLPPVDISGEGFDPWPRRLPPTEGETLGDQFEHLMHNDLPTYLKLNDQYKTASFHYTRYAMAGLEKHLVSLGIDMGRAWAHMEALETGYIKGKNEGYDWLKEHGEITSEFNNPIMRHGDVMKAHEILDDSERMAEWAKLMDKGYSRKDVEGFIDTDNKLVNWYQRWFGFLTGDDAFGITAEREIRRYMPHVRARQAQGVIDPYESTGYLSPTTQFFAEFAREDNMQFRVVDPRELGPAVVNAAMFKKHMAGPWEDFVSAWGDPRVPESIRNMMLGYARSIKFGYDPSGDMAVRGIQLVFDKMLDLPLTKREAQGFVGAPVNGMYMSMLAGRSSIFFRDATRVLSSLSKIRVNYLADVLKDTIKGLANSDEINTMYERALRGGWVQKEAPIMEGLGLFEEQGGLRQNELLGLTEHQATQRERLAQIGDMLDKLPNFLVHPTESAISTLKPYGKLQRGQRVIVGEAAWRQATAALSEYRHAEMMAALSKDPSLAIPYNQFAKDSFFSSFEEPIANRLREHVEAGNDEEAAMLFARQVNDWSMHKFGRREQPAMLRGGFGRVGSVFSNFSGQYLEGNISALSNGEPIHKARHIMVEGAVAAALAYATAKTGWNFGKWIWGRALAYSGGPAVDAIAELAAAAGGAVALSDDRKPSPFQSEALKAEASQSILPDPMSFFPYSGYLRSAAEYSAASQGINPIEQALRYTVTGDRGSKIDMQRQSQQRADELRQLIESRGAQQQGVTVPPGPPILRNPAYVPAPAQPRLPGHPGGGAMQ